MNLECSSGKDCRPLPHPPFLLPPHKSAKHSRASGSHDGLFSLAEVSSRIKKWRRERTSSRKRDSIAPSGSSERRERSIGAELLTVRLETLIKFDAGVVDLEHINQLYRSRTENERGKRLTAAPFKSDPALPAVGTALGTVLVEDSEVKIDSMGTLSS